MVLSSLQIIISKSVLWQVMSVKAIGIALKLTFSGMNQLVYPQTWAFTLVVVTCVLTQMNYLNKVIITSCLFFFTLVPSLSLSMFFKWPFKERKQDRNVGNVKRKNNEILSFFFKVYFISSFEQFIGWVYWNFSFFGDH